MKMDFPEMEITYIPADAIEIGERLRKDPGDIRDLAEDIKLHGLLHPIVVSGKRLIAGFRRYHACVSAGMKEIPCYDIKVLDEYTQKEIELAENIKRKQLSWTEEVRAVSELMALKQEQLGKAVPGKTAFDDGFGIKELAEMLNVSPQKVSADIQLARALDKNPALGEKKKKTAQKLVKAEREELERKLLIALMEDEEVDQPSSFTFTCAEAAEFLSTVPEKSVSCWIVDPSWGTIADRFEDATWDSPEGLKDFTAVLPLLKQTLLPGGFLYVFFPITAYQEIINEVRWVGFTVDPVPLIWCKVSPTESDYVTSRWGRAYEPILFAQLGKGRSLTAMLPNVITAAPPQGPERIHIAQKPASLLKILIENSTIEGETVGDCFAGSGAVLATALSLKRKAIGCEKDPAIYSRALTNVREAAVLSTLPSGGAERQIEGVLEDGRPLTATVLVTPTSLTIYGGVREDTVTVYKHMFDELRENGWTITGYPFDKIVGPNGTVKFPPEQIRRLIG